MVNKSLFSSASAEWATPQWLFDALDREFGLTLDPCSTDDNRKCELHFTKADDGLSKDWGEHVVFMNPPYGNCLADWIRKAFEPPKCGAIVVCLIPARTDTRWWHSFRMRAEIRFLRGRLRFIGGQHSAPFPPAVVVFRPPQFEIRAFETNASKNKHLRE